MIKNIRARGTNQEAEGIKHEGKSMYKEKRVNYRCFFNSLNADGK